MSTPERVPSGDTRSGVLARRLTNLIKEEGGQALVMVALLMLLGGLVLPPTLSLSMTALDSGEVHEKKVYGILAADAGLDHALWNFNYGDLDTLFTAPVYDAYDFTTSWSYSLAETVNGNSVNVSVQNVWIPTTIPTPNPTDARNIIETGKLATSGSVPGASDCEISIVFHPDPGDVLYIETLGVWLSPGFEYVTGSANLDDPVIQPYAGSEVLLWTFTFKPFVDMPGVDPNAPALTSTVTFQFTSTHPGSSPVVVSWVTTSGVADVPYAWDADSTIHRITSTALSTTGDTGVESYVWASDGDFATVEQGDFDVTTELEDPGGIYAAGDITLSDGAEIEGDVGHVYSEGDITLSGGAEIEEEAGDLCVYAGGDILLLTSGGKKSEIENEVGDVCVCAGGDIILGDDAKIKADAGDVNVYVAGDLTLGDEAWIGGDVYVGGDVTLGNGAYITGSIYPYQDCPCCTLSVGVTAEVLTWETD